MTTPREGQEPWRWFGKDAEGNALDDSELAYWLDADSMIPDFVEAARGWAEDLSSLRAEVAKLRGALELSVEHLQSCCPANGWGLLDHGADADRKETLKAVRAALEPPTEKSSEELEMRMGLNEIQPEQGPMTATRAWILDKAEARPRVFTMAEVTTAVAVVLKERGARREIDRDQSQFASDLFGDFFSALAQTEGETE
jgi:hypothetical protein